MLVLYMQTSGAGADTGEGAAVDASPSLDLKRY